ncbi:hypothetical protein RHSIM_Rhsim07G0002100 [Rhododendron simsii]|uniref:TFIIS-type domain-containing protein n=1 Tax=Rhododendron simsii TaxID=118357 RepID=A0A834GR63_RHOSS|nr:hypothetical protein RHSIM_Rhsim07G0002100 [Rhododendron simsii]
MSYREQGNSPNKPHHLMYSSSAAHYSLMYICNCVVNGLLGILKVKIKRRQHLVEKEVEPIFSKDDMKNGPTTEATCPNCSFGKAVFQQLQIRSADEPMSTFYWCLNEKCGQQWRED